MGGISHLMGELSQCFVWTVGLWLILLYSSNYYYYINTNSNNNDKHLKVCILICIFFLPFILYLLDFMFCLNSFPLSLCSLFCNHHIFSPQKYDRLVKSLLKGHV